MKANRSALYRKVEEIKTQFEEEKKRMID